VRYTRGFSTEFDLDDHFLRHGAEFKALSAEQYEFMADFFLGSVRKLTTLECIRPGGDLVRFDQLSGEFGVLRKDRVIRTYYILFPGITHHMPSNIDYFRRQCAQRF